LVDFAPTGRGSTASESRLSGHAFAGVCRGSDLVNTRPVTWIATIFLGASSPAVMSADTTSSADATKIDEISVAARRIANESPASSYASLATALRFDPSSELQSRGIAEGQSDVSVRGGLFENTGFKLGAVTVMDPQTGHYVAELPVDPVFLTRPVILKGVDSAIEGFNSSVATVSYRFAKLHDTGHFAVGAGSDNLNFQSLRFARATSNAAGNEIGVALSLARSAGDGSRPFGDHRFARYNFRLQHVAEHSQTDLVLSYQDKFFGWPGAYTGFATLPEIDDTQTSLLLLNHRRETDDGWFEVGGYYRRLRDDYDFNRLTSESGAPGSFEHESRVVSVGLQGLRQVGRIGWRFGGQLTKDELVSSTDLTSGSFNRRTYATLSLVPSFAVDLASGARLTWRAGATFDYSNHDSNSVSPLLGLALNTSNANGTTVFAVEYAATSQLPGYTVLKSNPLGLFGGNAALGREKAKQLSVSVSRETDDWQATATVFGRRDDDLVDWTFSTGAPFQRQANAVDIDVAGVEFFLMRNWDAVNVVLGFTVLDKDADYGSALVDASFYALNFAKQRATLAVTYRFSDSFELRLDQEYRRQEENPLRVGDDSTYLLSASLVWKSDVQSGLGVTLVIDNATDSEYQPFPGTPASGRQISLTASYDW
jgi:hypothetical protein